MKSLALQRRAFATEGEYQEAACDLADDNRQALAQLLGGEGEPEEKVKAAVALLRAWGQEHDALWERRVADAQRRVNP